MSSSSVSRQRLKVLSNSADLHESEFQTERALTLKAYATAGQDLDRITRSHFN